MPDRPEPASDSITALSRFLVGETTLAALLDQVEELGRKAVAADMAGITLLDENGRAHTAVFTDPTAPQIDTAQYETGDGPCLSAFAEREIFIIPDTETDTRWVEFCQAAAAHGVLSTLSLPMVVEQRGIGALNFYSRRREAFGPEEAGVGTIFAEHASVAIANAQAYWGAFELSQQLSEAMKSRATIEQAKGVLMAAQGCGPDEAFDTLRRASQRSNRKLRDIATEVVANAQQRRTGRPNGPQRG